MYDDIINMKAHVSLNRPRMSMENRAAQFAPFSALTGYEEAIKEMGRLTEEKIELDNGLKLLLSDKLNEIDENINLHRSVSFTYFLEDKKKCGGKYVEIVGIVKKIDSYKQVVVLENNTKIPIDDIINIKFI